MTNKSRSSDPQTISWSYDSFLANGQFYTTVSGEYQNLPDKIESIVSDNNPHGYNNCLHTILTPTFYGGSETYTLWDNRKMRGNNFAYSITDCPLNLPPSPAPDLGMKQFLLRAIQRSVPKFKGDVSIPNFLFELKDLKRTLPSSKRVSELGDIVRLAVGNPFRTSKKYTKKLAYYQSSKYKSALRMEAIRDLKDEIANQHLSANFGYLPLISDCYQIVDDVKLFNLRLSEFKKGLNKTRTFHFKESGSGLRSSEVVYLTTGTTEFSYIDVYDSVEWVATLYASASSDISRLSVPSVFRKYIGFRDNPRILWDAIPFSFLVDWVSNFGKFLERYDGGAIPVHFVVHSMGVSTKYKARREIYCKDLRTYGYYSFTKKKVGEIGINVYDRRRIEDFDYSTLEGLPPLPQFKGLNFKQVTLGLALANNIFKR